MAGKDVTRVYMVRHGATQLSAEDRFAGAVNVECIVGDNDAGATAHRGSQDVAVIRIGQIQSRH